MLIIIIINNNNNYLSSFNFDNLDYIPPLHQNEFRLDSIACLKAKHDLSSGKLVVISGPSPLQMGDSRTLDVSLRNNYSAAYRYYPDHR
jgi:hypothetical protein